MGASNVVEFPNPANIIPFVAEIAVNLTVPVSDVLAAASVLSQIELAVQLALSALNKAPEYGSEAALDAAVDIMGALSSLLA